MLKVLKKMNVPFGVHLRLSTCSPTIWDFFWEYRYLNNSGSWLFLSHPFTCRC